MSTYLIEPPSGLLEQIIKRIRREERLLVLRNTIVFSLTLLASLIAVYPVTRMFFSDASQIGFLNFFALIFSDFSTVAAYWKNFSMALLETLPAVSLALFLAVVLVFLQSIRSLTKNIKILSKNKLAVAN